MRDEATMRRYAGKCGEMRTSQLHPPPAAPLGQGWGKVRVGAWCTGARARSNHWGGPSWDDGVPVKSRSGLLRTQGREHRVGLLRKEGREPVTRGQGRAHGVGEEHRVGAVSCE